MTFINGTVTDHNGSHSFAINLFEKHITTKYRTVHYDHLLLVAPNHFAYYKSGSVIIDCTTAITDVSEYNENGNVTLSKTYGVYDALYDLYKQSELLYIDMNILNQFKNQTSQALDISESRNTKKDVIMNVIKDSLTAAGFDTRWDRLVFAKIDDWDDLWDDIVDVNQLQEQFINNHLPRIIADIADDLIPKQP